MKTFLTLANSLSIFRLVVAPVLAWMILSNRWLTASFLLILAILSDIFDGRIARRKNQDSAFGGLLDHSCDAFLVAVLLFVLSKTHGIPLFLPLLVLGSFLQYVLDSKALSGHKLRTSFLGRSNGIAYYVLASICIFTEALGINFSGNLFIVFAWVLISSTAVSMSERLWTLLNK
ncbi:MAG TPA: CDP-alcohol phosphatidyltransferase family protein [Gammaproteobacteria bacterium]|nr:CDP-alcohol phosphatidyltransferase family protein [Gammaproteobacteria bacterium]HIK72463.1 CDP-alcohol phosphatidyltransferase family protein [Gammaproteobacteria bacterium]